MTREVGLMNKVLRPPVKAQAAAHASAGAPGASPIRAVLRRLGALTTGLLLVAVAHPAVGEAADACPNGALRAQQHAESLGECRAYELVSPANKEGIAIDRRGTVQSARSGGAVAYRASGAFAGAGASLLGNYYLSRRGSSGWTTDPLDAPQVNGAATGTPTLYLSSGLETAVQASQVALLPGAIDNGSNIYRRDNATGLRALAFAAPGWRLMSSFADIGQVVPFGASEDLSHFSFASTIPLTPDAVVGRNNVYENVDGQTRLVNRLPDGSVGDDASFVNGGGLRAFRPVTPDGRRVAFNSPSNSISGAVYLRIDGSETVLISGSRRSGDDPTTPRSGSFVGMGDDGTYVYFRSSEALTDDAVDGAAGGSLYRLNTRTGALANLSVITDPADLPPRLGGVFGVSHDGTEIYFYAVNALASGAVVGDLNVYRADLSGIRLIAHLENDGGVGLSNYATSDDLRYLAFTSNSRPTGFDNTDPDCTGPGNACSEVFVYDAVKDALSCATCVGDHDRNVASSLGPQDSTVSNYVSRVVLDDGTVFFTSGEALVAEDSNGRNDAYRWKDGKVSLISSGTSPEDSVFAEASPDGRDAFFLTYAGLVGTDTDGEIDLYDARVDGGIAAQNEVPTRPVCDGDACQGTPSTKPGVSVAGSVSFAGSAPAPDAGRVARVDKPVVSKVGTVHGTLTQIRVKVAAAGRIAVSGTGVRAVSRSVTKAGSYRMVVRLSTRSLGVLKRRHRLTVGLTVRFSPARGEARSVGVPVTFTTAAARKGRS
jgi:hypothetical protein